MNGLTSFFSHLSEAGVWKERMKVITKNKIKTRH